MDADDITNEVTQQWEDFDTESKGSDSCTRSGTDAAAQAQDDSVHRHDRNAEVSVLQCATA